jgi:predicted Zn-dependent protease with MMP-like domain
MTREQFEQVAQSAFDSLPEEFKRRVDNVHIVVEDYPSDDVLASTRSRRDSLLGLYQGVPLPHRNTWYGTSPTAPDTITLYQKNIEAVSKTEEDVERRIAEVLFHEIGHYFGMNEREIRAAMKHFQ